MKKYGILLLLLCSTAGAQQFSAEMVEKSKTGGSSTRKMYVCPNRLRLEGLPQQPGMLVDLGAGTTYMLLVKEKMYMVMKDAKGQMMQGMSLLAPADPKDPCATWKKTVPGLTCTKIGIETLNGRSVEKWEGTRGGEKDSMWFDPKIGFIVKLDDKERTIELRNIQEGQQPAGLFDIPADFRKMN
ncbi:MAG: hypothetical protein NVS1B11_25920 [Terriglobales bacterium]